MRRTGLLARLLPSRRPAPQPTWRDVHAQALVVAHRDLTALEAELEQLRESTALTTAGAVMAELRAQRLERELVLVRAETAALRSELAALREELVWAFAEGKLPTPKVIDLTQATAATA